MVASSVLRLFYTWRLSLAIGIQKKKQRTIGSIVRPNIFFFLNIGNRMEENVISNWRIITSLLQRIIIRNDIIWYFHVYFLWTNDRFTSGNMFRFHQFVSRRWINSHVNSWRVRLTFSKCTLRPYSQYIILYLVFLRQRPPIKYPLRATP